jgi:hypothetical protein
MFKRDRHPWRKLLVGQFALAGFWATVQAGGISTHFAEMRVGDLQPGRTYVGSRDVTGEPYTVANNTDEPLDLIMAVRVPETSELQPGYEPIPDVGWIRFHKSFFTAPAGQAGTNDYYISIPSGETHLGKKYQVQLGVRTFGGSSFVQMGLMGRALLSVTEKAVPMTGKEAKAFGFSSQISLSPPAVVGQIPADDKSISFDKVLTSPLVLKNEGDYPVRCRIEVVETKESFVYPPPDFVPAPKDIKVKIRKQRLTLAPHSEAKIEGTLRLPKRLIGNKENYYVVLRVVTEGTPGEVEAFTRLFLKGAP